MEAAIINVSFAIGVSRQEFAKKLRNRNCGANFFLLNMDMPVLGV